MNTGVQLIEDASATEFLAGAGHLLYEREAEYGLMLGLAEGLQKRSPEGFTPLFLRTVDNRGITRAAFIQTRVENGIITHASSLEINLFADYLRSQDTEIHGIVGPTSAAQTFAERFECESGKGPNLGMAQKVLELREVIFPASCDGGCEKATSCDLDLITEWIVAFEREAILHSQPDQSAARKLAQQKIENGDLYLWKTDLRPVTMAATGRPTKSGITVNLVYTPPPHRGRGYASNLVAAISQNMLNSGRSFCVLYTDAANPTSNKIYQAVGYRVIGESAHYLIKPKSAF